MKMKINQREILLQEGIRILEKRWYDCIAFERHYVDEFYYFIINIAKNFFLVIR